MASLVCFLREVAYARLGTPLSSAHPLLRLFLEATLIMKNNWHHIPKITVIINLFLHYVNYNCYNSLISYKFSSGLLAQNVQIVFAYFSIFVIPPTPQSADAVIPPLKSLFQHQVQCPLWVISGNSAPCLFMSAFGGKADVIADPSACLLIARSGHPARQPISLLHPVSA